MLRTSNMFEGGGTCDLGLEGWEINGLLKCKEVF